MFMLLALSILVVDGDTLKIDGQRLRIMNIAAAELNGECRYERELAAKAKARVIELNDEHVFESVYSGHEDRYRRPRVLGNVEGKDLREMLIEEGVAQPWTGRQPDWCDGPQTNQ